MTAEKMIREALPLAVRLRDEEGHPLPQMVAQRRASLQSEQDGSFRAAAIEEIARFAEAREALKEALGLALGILSKGEPPDSRAVSNEFVAMAAVHCDDYSDNVMEIIRKAQSALQSEPRQG